MHHSTRNPFTKGYLKTQAPAGAIEIINFNSKNFTAIKNAINNSDIVINSVEFYMKTENKNLILFTWIYLKQSQTCVHKLM